jgi:hypothetical protein
MKNYLKVSSLSCYTIAKNCTDLDDLKTGLNELREWKLNRERNNLPIQQIWYNKVVNLGKKASKLTSVK